MPKDKGPEKIGLYPASFDPMTVAHLGIAERAARMLDKLYVAVAVNPAKKGMFDVEERFSMVKACIEDIPGTEATVLESGLTVDHARRLGAGVMIRGARSVTDFLEEVNLFGQNLHVQQAVGMGPESADFVDTQTYYALPGQDHVSSTIVRALMLMPETEDRVERIRPLVPQPVFDVITARIGA